MLPPALRGPVKRLYKRFRGNIRYEFELESTVAWLSVLRDSGIVFVFPEGLDAAGAKSLAILKHDIHHDLDRAVAMARAEHERELAGIYFMMGPHVLNAEFYGSRRSWEQLRTIQSLGHRIGLHLDVVGAIFQHGNLETEIEKILAQFSAEGLVVRYANSHGNTRLRSLGVGARDFFMETGRDLPRLIASDPTHRRVLGQLGRYSLKEIGARFGLRYWIDNLVLRDGIVLSPVLYVTDNSGAIRIPARKISSGAFEVDDAFIAASVPALSGARSLILLHPQWYAPRSGKNAANAPSEPGIRRFKPRIVADVRDLDLKSGDLVDVSVRTGGFRYDVRLNRRKRADHLIVALHGGVQGAKSLPLLARWAQHSYFRAPILSFFDPLIYEHPGIPAGWFVGDLARDATDGIADIVRGIAARMGIATDRIVFLGNSSGGFAAARLACALSGAKFVSINGQSRIVDYQASGYGPFSAAFDPTHTPRENATRHENRWSILPALEQALRSGDNLRGVVIQNVNDKHHFEKHYTLFCTRFGVPLAGGTSADGRLRSVIYEGETTHGPETPDIARRIVKELIPDLLK